VAINFRLPCEAVQSERPFGEGGSAKGARGYGESGSVSAVDALGGDACA